jgi:hypothetical protein
VGEYEKFVLLELELVLLQLVAGGEVECTKFRLEE